jgi:hypothetical protein
MIGRSLLCVVGAVFLVAADEPPPVPSVLEPYLVDGRFEPGDYGWMKGAFDDAGEADRQAFLEVMAWSAECQKQAGEDIRASLAQLGYPGSKIGDFGQGPVICRSLITPSGQERESYTQFAEELVQLRPIMESYLLAVRVAEETVAPRPDDPLADQIKARTVGEQMVRHAISWGVGVTEGAPELTTAGRSIWQARVIYEMMVRDDDNTQWLKQVVSEHGWPKISDVGRTAAGAAWLLVQHADADPVFQVQVLQAMEPLLAEGEVEPQSYALLYDRVMLKLVGTQRYGTQFMFQDGQFVPQSMEDADRVEQWRTEVGLGTLAENQARIRESYGSC